MEIDITTVSAKSSVEDEYPDNVVVRHVYWRSDSEYRYTSYYLCNGQSSADVLVSALNKLRKDDENGN